jgi:hypothetical protein
MKAGDVFDVKYPFVRCEVDVFDGVNSFVPTKSWRPGCEPYCDESDHGHYREPGTEWVAHAYGSMILEVIDLHKPGKYPERVFYIRQWKAPNGVVFGKGQLRITTKAAFKRLCAGYRHEVDIVGDPEDQSGCAAIEQSHRPNENEAVAQPQAGTGEKT